MKKDKETPVTEEVKEEAAVETKEEQLQKAIYEKFLNGENVRFSAGMYAGKQCITDPPADVQQALQTYHPGQWPGTGR